MRGCSLAVLSPGQGGLALSQFLALSQSLPVPGATAVPVPGGTGHPGHKDPAAGELWDPVECSGSHLPFPHTPEGKANPDQQKERKVEINPGLQEPQLGQSPRGGVGLFSLFQLQLPNHWKQEHNLAEKWEFPLLFCPGTVCDCRAAPPPRRNLSEIWVSLLQLAYL